MPTRSPTGSEVSTLAEELFFWLDDDSSLFFATSQRYRTEPRQTEGFYGAEFTARRRPANTAIVVRAVQPANIASPKAMPGVLEMSTTLVAAKSAVAKSPATGARCDARAATKITTVGAKNGTTTSTANKSLSVEANHQVGLPTVEAETPSINNDARISICVAMRANFQLGVSEPARRYWARLGGGRDDIARPTIA